MVNSSSKLDSDPTLDSRVRESTPPAEPQQSLLTRLQQEKAQQQTHAQALAALSPEDRQNLQQAVDDRFQLPLQQILQGDKLSQ